MDILALYQKKVDPLEIRDSLTKYIVRQYGENVAKDYETVLGAVQQLRNEIKNLEDRKEPSRDVLLKYFVHLRNIEAHFPFNDGNDKVRPISPSLDNSQPQNPNTKNQTKNLFFFFNLVPRTIIKTI